MLKPHRIAGDCAARHQSWPCTKSIVLTFGKVQHLQQPSRQPYMQQVVGHGTHLVKALSRSVQYILSPLMVIGLESVPGDAGPEVYPIVEFFHTELCNCICTQHLLGTPHLFAPQKGPARQCRGCSKVWADLN